MYYKKEVNDFEKALKLNNVQIGRLKTALTKAYEQNWHKDGPNIDQINAFVAPYIHTMEEAFYVSQVIMSDVFGAMMKFQTANN